MAQVPLLGCHRGDTCRTGRSPDCLEPVVPGHGGRRQVRCAASLARRCQARKPQPEHPFRVPAAGSRTVRRRAGRVRPCRRVAAGAPPNERRGHRPGPGEAMESTGPRGGPMRRWRSRRAEPVRGGAAVNDARSLRRHTEVGQEGIPGAVVGNSPLSSTTTKSRPAPDGRGGGVASIPVCLLFDSVPGPKPGGPVDWALFLGSPTAGR